MILDISISSGELNPLSSGYIFDQFVDEFIKIPEPRAMATLLIFSHWCWLVDCNSQYSQLKRWQASGLSWDSNCLGTTDQAQSFLSPRQSNRGVGCGRHCYAVCHSVISFYLHNTRISNFLSPLRKYPPFINIIMVQQNSPGRLFGSSYNSLK